MLKVHAEKLGTDTILDIQGRIVTGVAATTPCEAVLAREPLYIISLVCSLPARYSLGRS